MNNFNTEIISEILKHFKENFRYELKNQSDVFAMEQDLLAYLVELGRALEQELFNENTGYEGNTVTIDDEQFTFHEYTTRQIHALFGKIFVKRAYYKSNTKNIYPLDEKLALKKGHTPGCEYFITKLVGMSTYEEGRSWFNEIFRAHQEDIVSERKTQTMTWKTGASLEEQKQEEIKMVFEHEEDVEKIEPVQNMAVMIDAAKVREWKEENGQILYENEWKDVKIGAVSNIYYNEKTQRAHCENISYVAGVESPETFFERMYVEMKRRGLDENAPRVVFVNDGAPWIMNRIADLIGTHDFVSILDYYHATEHVALVAKTLYKEGSEKSVHEYERWKTMLYEGAVEKVIAEYKTLLKKYRSGEKRKKLYDNIRYFSENKTRMHYDEYRKMKIPMGSGSVESACRYVVGGRLKGAGMTWKSLGAEAMLAIRCSIKSGRYYREFKEVICEKSQAGERKVA